VKELVMNRRSGTVPNVLTEELIYAILSVVEEIPEGKVASYGQIAKLIGREKNARLVGKVLSMAEYYGKYPCHRVVDHTGRLAPHFREQRSLLVYENVEFKDNTHVNMKTCRWDC
jgi:methylated-DNA-protein-cysteine methyltransferase-like protein